MRPAGVAAAAAAAALLLLLLQLTLGGVRKSLLEVYTPRHIACCCCCCCCCCRLSLCLVYFNPSVSSWGEGGASGVAARCCLLCSICLLLSAVCVCVDCLSPAVSSCLPPIQSSSSSSRCCCCCCCLPPNAREAHRLLSPHTGNREPPKQKETDSRSPLALETVCLLTVKRYSCLLILKRQSVTS